MEKEGMGDHPGELIWLPIDLTDPRKAKAAATWFVKRESRLDILGTRIECSFELACLTDQYWALC
jgi:hypothetical protein